MKKIYFTSFILFFSFFWGNTLLAQSSLSTSELTAADAASKLLLSSSDIYTEAISTALSQNGIAEESVFSIPRATSMLVQWEDGTISRIKFSSVPTIGYEIISVEFEFNNEVVTKDISSTFGEFVMVPGQMPETFLLVYHCEITDQVDFSQGQFYWEDLDEDGYISEKIVVFGCSRPPGFITEEEILGIDCNDKDSSITTQCCPPIEGINFKDESIVEVTGQATLTIDGCNTGSLETATGLPYFTGSVPKNIPVEDFIEKVGTIEGVVGCLQSAYYRDELVPNANGIIEVKRTFYLQNRYYGRGQPIPEVVLVILIEDKSGPIPALEILPDLVGECSLTATKPLAFDCQNPIYGKLTPEQYDFTEQGEYTLTWTYDDGNGNISSQEQKVIIKDVTPPVLMIKNIDLQLDETGNASISITDIDNGTSDNCTDFEDLEFELSQMNFSCSDEGVVSIDVKVTDLVGNISQGSVEINVLEPLIPISTEILSSVPKNSNDNVVIFSNAPAALGLPSATSLTAGNIPPAYIGLTYEWSVAYGESDVFEVITENNASLEIVSAGDLVATYKVVVTSNSGCIAEDLIQVVSVEASCDKGGTNKVQVCQIINGDPNKRKTICINANAVETFLANSPGSFIGNCSVSYRMKGEPELITVQWNTPVQVIEQKITNQSENWFELRKVQLNIASSAYNPLKSGMYEFEVDFEGAEGFMLEEAVKVQVQVLEKPAPLSIELSKTTLSNQPKEGEVIAELRTNDPIDTIHEYTLSPNENFAVEGNKLVWKGMGSPQAKMSFTIFSTDRAGNVISKEVNLRKEILPNDFLMYPNPAKTETTIVVQLDEPASVTISLLDATGKFIVNETLVRDETFEQRIDLQGLSSGLYYVQVKVGYMIVTKRLIKQE